MDNGRQHTNTYDSRGNVLTSTDPVGSITYVYGPHGKPIAVTSNGSTVTMEYDDVANQTKLIDPDAGTIEYTFDVLGRVKTEKGALGVITSCTYNRVINETWSVGLGNESLQYSYTYGSNGLLSTKSFPGGISVVYGYDAYGNHVSTSYNSNTIWELQSDNGLFAVEKHGNSITMEERLNSTTGYLASQYLKVGGTTKNYSVYAFNGSTGNLGSRISSGVGFVYYSYDTLDRLVRVTSGTSSTIDYAANGNILYKTEMGHYGYSSDKPHAVTSVENTNNLMSGKALRCVFNDVGKIRDLRIEETEKKLLINYGSDDQRFESSYYENNNLVWKRFYLNGLDIHQQNSCTKWYYDLGDGVLCIRTVPSSGSASVDVCCKIPIILTPSDSCKLTPCLRSAFSRP